MSQPFRIYVSATKDLENQRGVLSRTLAQLPVQVGAEIRRYPPSGVSYETLFEMISNVDQVYFLMGRDITAPSGAEWDLALHLEKPILAYRVPVPLTPAAQAFMRRATDYVPASQWNPFRSDVELAALLEAAFINRLLHPQNRYGLRLHEIESLRQRLQNSRTDSRGFAEEAGGSEGGGVILGRESLH